MSNFISGEDLLKRLDLRPFELFNHVKNGLQPFDQFGKPIPPPNIKDKSERLKKIKIQLEENPRTLRLKEGTIKATSPPGFRSRLLGDVQRRYASMNKSLQNEIETLTNELDIIENKYSWSNYELPEDEQSAKLVMDSLLKALFDVQAISDIKTNTEKEFISGNDVIESGYKKHELMDAVRKGLRAWHPVYLKPIKQGILPNPLNVSSDIIGKIQWRPRGLNPYDEKKDYNPFEHEQLPFEHKKLPAEVYKIEELYPFLEDCLFLKEDVEVFGKAVIQLGPEKLRYPERVKTAKLKIVKEIATAEDLKKLEELKQFDEDEIITSNKWDDATGETETGEAFFDGMEVGKRESLNESIKIADSKLQSIRGKKGGIKSKINQPILLAITKYLQNHPKLEGKTNYQIAESFKRHVGKHEPIIVNFNECEWDVYFADNYIEAIADATNKKKHKDKSIAYSTFMNSYISKAKKIIKNT